MSCSDTTLLQTITDFQVLLRRLRKDCPWDKVQTFQSLIQHSIEEVYELQDAVIRGDRENIQEELGDLLEHLFFYHMLAEEQGWFSIQDTIIRTHQKLISRHPHIFGAAPPLHTVAEVLAQWQQLKKKEGKKQAFAGISRTLPAMVKALRMQQKAAQLKFDFADASAVWEKVKEEEGELAQAVAEGTNIEEEMGDILFALINYARHLNIDPEAALQKTNEKFRQRFNRMEDLVANQGKTLLDLDNQGLAQCYEQARRQIIEEAEKK